MTQVVDAFTWSIAYHDNTVLHEFDESRPDGRAWAEIGEKQVKTVMLATPEVDRVHRVAIPVDAQPVFFRRRYVTINSSGQNEGDSIGCLAHCIGWKHGDEAVYFFILPDGNTFLSNDLQAV